MSASEPTRTKSEYSRARDGIIPPERWDASPFKDRNGHSVTGYTPLALIGWAVKIATPLAPGRWPRWVAIKDTFGLGSTFASELCRLAGLDPDEYIDGPVCERCAEFDAACKPDVIGPDCDYPNCGCGPTDKCKGG